MIVLVTGSREASDRMRQLAKQTVEWAAKRGHSIIVGEAPGIDEEVRLACWVLELSPQVWGAKNIFRQPEINPEREQRFTVKGGYLARDREMARRAQRAVAIWNGLHKERSGTYYTGKFMEDTLKRPVRWWNDLEER